jgi:nucleoside-diphosphate kinase
MKFLVKPLACFTRLLRFQLAQVSASLATAFAVAIVRTPTLNYIAVFTHPKPVNDFEIMQQTLIIFKPDCVQRRLVGTILERFEAKGLRIAALKLIKVDRAIAEKHYAEHHGKPFFEGLISFITSSPVVVGVLAGNEAITVVRAMLGATNGAAAAPGTVRGDFSISKQNNLMHGSDSPESAQREIALWFRPEELVDYGLAGGEWVFGGA